jgi:uncharacterized protein
MHHRLEPRRHRFRYSVFMFYLDLDEIDALSRKLRLMSRNRFNLFNFRDLDHLQWPASAPETGKPVREQIVAFLGSQGVSIGHGRIMLLTNLCTLGYQFNPVSFYFCYDEQDRPVCSVAEVGNTFREMKPYFLGQDRRSELGFRATIPKYFYVSPYTRLDTSFDFDLALPDNRLQIRIDDYDREGRRFFISTLSGKRKSLNDANLLRYFLNFPLITLKVIGLIHWEALRLWLKRLPYHKKNANQDLQRDVLRPYKQT